MKSLIQQSACCKTHKTFVNVRVWQKQHFAEAVARKGTGNGTSGAAHALSASSASESRTLSVRVPFQRNAHRDAAVARKERKEERPQ
jgi:hypothetical protein